MDSRGDAYADIESLCRVPPSDVELLRHCRFAGEPQEDSDDRDEEMLVEEEEAILFLDSEGIVMLSLPETPPEVEISEDAEAPREVYHTPPEECEQLKSSVEEKCCGAAVHLEADPVRLESIEVRVCPREEVENAGQSNPKISKCEKSPARTAKEKDDDVAQIRIERRVGVRRKRELPKSICGGDEQEDTAQINLGMKDGKQTLIDLLRMLDEENDKDADIDSISLLDIARKRSTGVTSNQHWTMNP